MSCSESEEFLVGDATQLLRDCEDLDAQCVEVHSGSAACVLPDSSCVGLSGCNGDRLASCIRGKVAAGSGIECDHGCETLPTLGGIAACVRPDECGHEGDVSCADAADAPNEAAVYRLCIRPGWAADYRCNPPLHVAGTNECADAVLHVPCWSERPDASVGADDADAGR